MRAHRPSLVDGLNTILGHKPVAVETRRRCLPRNSQIAILQLPLLKQSSHCRSCPFACLGKPQYICSRKEETRGLLTNSPLSQQAGADPKIRIDAVDGENDDGRRRPLPKRPPLTVEPRAEPTRSTTLFPGAMDGIHGNGIVGGSPGASLKLSGRFRPASEAIFHSALPLNTTSVCWDRLGHCSHEAQRQDPVSALCALGHLRLVPSARGKGRDGQGPWERVERWAC